MKNLKSLLSILLIIVLSDFSYAQDWANLKRFQKENSEISNPKPGEHRIVFMGNSITEGWLRIRPDFFAGKPYINRGISGETTPQMLLRFRQDVINLTPSVVVILAGINDIAENTGPSTIDMIVDNIISMCELAKANNIKVVLCSVLPAIDFPWRKGLEPAGKIIKLNSLIKAYTIKSNIEYVDYFTVMENESNGLKDDLCSDGVHPNAKGYSIMEPLLENALLKLILN
jgi:lysophospholipase L1-like esterase